MRSLDAGKRSGTLHNRLKPIGASRVGIHADAFNVFN